MILPYARMKVMLPRRVPPEHRCRACNGNGYLSGRSYDAQRKCPTCKGSGRAPIEEVARR